MFRCLMSALGHERRPLRSTAAPRLPLCLVCDRVRLAMQYVATGQQPTCRAPKEPQELRYRSENASTKYRVKRVLFLPHQ
jgi:hypothetical protein